MILATDSDNLAAWAVSGWTLGKCAALLDAHSMSTASEGGKLEVLEVWLDTLTGERGATWIDVTGWSRGRVLAWLGY